MPDVQNKVKAVHGYKVTDTDGAVNVEGKRFHFIGAGGVGMSGLAQLLIKNSGIVSGSDQIQSPVVKKLCEMGADIRIGHKADNLSSQMDAVVISAAIKEDNPELKQARKRGCKIYNFWGITPTDSPRHPWAGLTLFKKGFGGYKKEYVKTQDLPLSGQYWINYLVERIRRSKRGL